MKKYGNFLFNRRVVVSLLLCLCTLAVLMPCQIVKADSFSSASNWTFRFKYFPHGQSHPEEAEWEDHKSTLNYTSNTPVFSYILENKNKTPGYDESENWHYLYCGFVTLNQLVSYSTTPQVSVSNFIKSGVNFYENYHGSTYINSQFAGSTSDIFVLCDGMEDGYSKIANFIKTGEKSDGMIIGGSGYLPNSQAYSEIGCLDNVQMETYVTNKKELIDADENADLSKINQDKVIVYSSSTTSGIDLSKGGYRVQLYGSYAWQDKKGNIKSEDKGHKTFIKDWDAQDNIKGLDRSKYRWIDWNSANGKVEADRTDKAHKPNVFEKMTTYANYQYEPIWYLRIVSQDNKFGAWVKLYNSTNKGKYRSESVDDDDNAVPDSGGGYNKPKDTSEITGTGDTPEDAKNNVPKAEEKQDNDDLNDSANGNNSTFDKLEQFTKGIGDVPKIVADIFSFLPSWCLEVVAIGFALLMILVVVKFIRG